jgi:membrane dipeptidase
MMMPTRDDHANVLLGGAPRVAGPPQRQPPWPCRSARAFRLRRTLLMRRTLLPLVTSAVVAFGLAACASAQRPASVGAPGAAAVVDESLVARARAIHDRVIALDTHVDINPANFRLGQPNYRERLNTQVNIPKMEEGGLDAAFLIVYVGQTPSFSPEAYARATAQAIEKFEAIHRLVDSIAPDRVALARTPDDVLRISAQGKKAILIGVENGYPIGNDIANVRRFHALGARYLSLAHNGHSQLSDSNTGERDGIFQWNGVSPFGEQVIAELNRVGVMIDISHPSKASMMRTLQLSKAPIIASHSAVRALANHSRNLDDEQLKALARNGGVAQIVAFDGYVKIRTPDSPERIRALNGLREEFGPAPP